MSWMSTYVVVEISPDTTTSPVFTSVSQATRPFGSSRITASSTPSEIWSAILSGWPSVTDSEVNRNSLSESTGVVIEAGKGSRTLARPAKPAAWLTATLEIDDERHALQLVALAQAVLYEVGVVTGDQLAVVDLDREARRGRFELAHVVHAQALAAAGRGLADVLDVREEAVQVGGLDEMGRAGGEVQRLRPQPLQAPARLRRHGHHLRTLAQLLRHARL